MDFNNNPKMVFTAARIDEMVQTLSHAHCEFRVMDQAYLDLLAYPQLALDNHDQPLRIGAWYMIVTAANGYPYYVNVTADSPYAACEEVFKYIQSRI